MVSAHHPMADDIKPTPPHHGGQLRKAAEKYGIPLANWLDLSTGINPNGWPVPPLPENCWNRLPENNDGLIEVARDYYQTESILPVAGSQAAIQILPQLRAPCRVSVISPGYAEHAYAWQRCSHQVSPVSAERISATLENTDVLVLINPNNPTGKTWSRKQLLAWHAELASRGGWLVVDEAFMDATPEQSLAPDCPLEGLFVLRSPGKFFGLAGIRLGFLIAPEAILQKIEILLGPWTVTHPTRQIGKWALADKSWQENTRQQLIGSSNQLKEVLTQAELTPSGGTALFQWVKTPNAEKIHHSLAAQGIFTRLFDKPQSLRFGLPANLEAFSLLESRILA